MLLHVAIVHSFSSLCNILLRDSTRFFTPPAVNGHLVVSGLGLLCRPLL